MTRPPFPNPPDSAGLRENHVSTRQTESELRAANERLTGILGSISEMFVVLDGEWRVQDLSRRVLEMTGRSWSELRGRVVWDLFPESAKTDFKPGYERVMRDRIPHTFGVAYPNQDGSITHYQVHAFPTPDGIGALVSDVTAERRTENELAESKRMLHLVLDSAGVATWMWNTETGEVTDLANSAKLLGLDRITSLAEFLKVIHPDDRAEVEAVLDEARSSGRLETEYRVAYADGSVRRMRATGTLVPEQRGRRVRMAGVVADVTDRSRADEARNRLAAIVDSSDDAIVSKDLNGIVTSWNAGAAHLFGWRPEEMIGRSILTIIPSELQSEEPIILANMRAGKKLIIMRRNACTRTEAASTYHLPSHPSVTRRDGS